MKINHISVSRKDCFDLCHAQYKFKYHLNLPSPFQEPFYFVYGKTIHKIAELFVGDKEGRSLNEIARMVLSGQVPIEERSGKATFAPSLPQEYKERLPAHLRSIAKLTAILGKSGLTEYCFEYDLDPPNNRLVNGVIDRLIEKNGKFWIVDYKTTKPGFWRKTPGTITKDLQLRCYARAVQRKYNAPAENIQAALYYLEGGDLIGARFSEQSLVGVEQELLRTYLEIEAMDPNDARGKTGDHCKRCDYRQLCPYCVKGTGK